VISERRVTLVCHSERGEESQITLRSLALLPGFFAALRMTAIVLASVLVLAAMSIPALAQEPTATAAPMMLPSIPQIQLSPVPGYGPAPLTVGFFVTTTDPDTVLQTYRWNFGDGQVSTLPPIALFHTYTTPGSYVVTVTASTADGHQASTFAGVIVTPPAQ
jgi:PKD repeat protein